MTEFTTALSRYVALYCRISVDRAGRKEGVTAQERWGREYAARVWPGVPVRVFPDNDLSAAADDVVRPQYELLREAIGRGEVAHVWTVEQYRLERREVPWFQLAALMDSAGIRELHTNRDGIVRVRDAVAGIKAVLGAEEVRRLKRRINDSLAEKAAQGCPAGSRPFGYQYDRFPDGTKTFTQVPGEAEAIREAAEWVLSGWSLENIAKELRARGLRGAQGGELRPDSIRRMVVSPTVAGHRVYRGQIVGRGNWEAILDEATWQACRLRLSQPRSVTTVDGRTHQVTERHMGYKGRRYLLTGGLVVCGVCRHPMVGALKVIRGRRVPYLSCHPNKGGKGCTGILLDATENYVVTRLFAELDKAEFLDAIAADEHGPLRDRIAKQLDALEKQRGELAVLWATPGELTLTEWQEARRTIADNERRLRCELAELPPPALSVDVAGAREGWEDMTLDEKREFLRMFINTVTINRAPQGRFHISDPDTRVTIEWQHVQ